MCRAKDKGGRRCDTHLKELSGAQLLPPQSADLPTISWAGKPSEEPLQIFATHTSQAANAALNALLKAVRNEPQMTEQINAAISGHGAQLVGLKNRLKSPSSLARKIRKKEIERMMTPEQAAASLDDTIRYTVTTARVADLIPTLTASVNTLTAHGWTVRSAEQSFVKDNPYKGIHLILANSDGQRCEVQYHTESSLAAKARGHTDYELYRDIDQPPEVCKQAYERSVRTWADIPTPPGLRTLTTLGGVPVVIKDYRPKPPPRRTEDQP